MKIYMKLGRKPPPPDLRLQIYAINQVFFSKNPSLTQRLQL